MSLAGSVSDVSFLSKEWRPSSDAWSTFNDFRRQGIFCDVVLQAEGIRFPVHRLVLCACSNYFRALFLGGWKSSDRQEVEIPGISREILSCLLEFAYTGQVIITPYNVQELLPAADQFQVYYVKEKCCLYLKHHLSPTNCIGIWKYAQWFFCDNLRKAANDFMLRNFEDMSKTSQEFLKLSVEEVTNLISDDRLNVKVEDVVCEAIFRWVERSRKDRIAYLPRLLKNARLGLLNPEFFLKKVKENDLVREKIADCQTILNYAMTVVCDPGLNDADDAPPELMNLMRPRFPTAILLAVGGWSGGCATNAIEAYDTRSETWVNVSSMPGGNQFYSLRL